MLSANIFKNMASRGRSAARQLQVVAKRHGSSGGHGHGPHVPEFYDKLGKCCLVSAFFWIFYRAKDNKGQILGWYLPWLHEHDHLHLHYVDGGDQGPNYSLMFNLSLM